MSESRKSMPQSHGQASIGAGVRNRGMTVSLCPGSVHTTIRHASASLTQREISGGLKIEIYST